MTKLVKKINLAIFLLLINISSSFVANAALSADEAGNFIRGIADKVLSIVKENNLSEIEKEAKLTKLFEESVDINWMAKFVLGRHGKQISSADLNEYSKIYGEFLLKSYVPNFRKYTGENFKLLGVNEKKESEFRVDTEIIGQKNNPIDIDYMVRKTEKGYKIFDIIAENISLIMTQRQDFSQILSTESKGIKALITELQNRVK